MNSPMTLATRFAERLSLVLAWFAGITLTAMMVLACSNMIARACGAPIKGTFELIGFMGAVVAAFSLAYAQQSRSHIFVAFFVARFHRPVRLMLDAFVHLGSALFFAFAAWETRELALFIVDVGELSETLQLAYHPFVYAVSAGCAAMSVVLFIAFLRTVIQGEEG